MLADALGNPLSFTLTGAEQADSTQAPALLDAVKVPQAVIADKGYDADTLVEKIETSGAAAHIPPRSNRTHLGAYAPHGCKARPLIENLFARLSQFLRLATR